MMKDVLETRDYSTKKTERINYYSYLRVFACLSIVVIHCGSGVLQMFGGNMKNLDKYLVMSLVRFNMWAVPCFVMITGALLLDKEKLSISTAKLIRFGFLQQNAFHKEDTYVPLKKQREMMRVIVYLYEKVRSLISASIPMSKILSLGLFSDLIKMKYEIPNNKIEKFNDYISMIDSKVEKLIS